MFSQPKEHIFIVEDNEVYSMMLDYYLSKDNVYKFSTFRTGEDCIQNLYLNPQAIILDYELPGMNGYETLLAIKKYDPAIHVLILSSNENMKLVNDLLKAGADDYILKQGHGEKEIMEKIETLLATDQMKENEEINVHKKILIAKVRNIIALIILVIVAIVFYAF